ncbi:MAG: chloramphenicol acetyltransferase [Bacteroidetes bacterium]|jgi:chloramphenicol O-acetyltransferase type A|nr:chloramphenicol acetyltransferase [Bacteroidota bacterium]
MHTIDLENWKRREHFEFFYRMDYPQYNICANIDVTHFLRFVKEHNLPFYYAMIYAVTKVTDECENFRYRVREGKQVVLHDKLHPSFTDMSSDSTEDLFKFVTMDMEGTLFDFVHKAQEVSASQKCYFDFAPMIDRDDFLYITCIPWISFTHLSHTISINRNDSVPRISWGKYFEQDGKVLLPFSVQVHHAFVDGIHVGQYFEKLKRYCNQPE